MTDTAAPSIEGSLLDPAVQACPFPYHAEPRMPFTPKG